MFSFCESLPPKKITIHPNNKKLVTKDMKICLVQEKKAFWQGDKLRVRELEKEFRWKAKLAKINDKNKVEQLWQGLNIMMGCG